MIYDTNTTRPAGTYRKPDALGQHRNGSDPARHGRTGGLLHEQGITTVNFHLLEPCNMSCLHCFVPNLPTERLPLDRSSEIVRLLSQAGFAKINFAGGEPMLYSGLDSLIQTAKKNGMTTSIVTNGTRITDRWLDGIAEDLDMIALSVDSANPETHRRSGRAVDNRPLSTERYLKASRSIKRRGIRLKINTVVTCHNRSEDMRGFIRRAGPERWKIMQALSIAGQNDRNAGRFEVTDGQFQEYVERNRSVEQDGIRVVPEDNYLMTCSYVMVDPTGRLFGNMEGRYAYSRPILEAGIADALQEIKIDPERFRKRGGSYE